MPLRNEKAVKSKKCIIIISTRMKGIKSTKKMSRMSFKGHLTCYFLGWGELGIDLLLSGEVSFKMY